MKRNKAFSSLSFLISLFFLSVLLVALGFFLSNTDLLIKRKISSYGEKEKIDNILDSIVKELKSDSTPQGDSLFDSVWKFNNTKQDSYEIKIKALSGLLNLNYIDPKVFDTSNLNYLFTNNASIKTIKERIEEKNLLFSYEEVKDVIEKETFDKYFTFYSYANFNIVDLNALRLLGTSLVNSYFGDELSQKSKSLRNNKQLIQKEIDFNMLCGVHYDEIYPIINIQPQMNINFIPEEILRSLLTYPGFRLSNINSKVNQILNIRSSRELRSEDITNILGITQNSELYYYMGCKNYFWDIEIIGKNLSCQIIIARNPEDSISGNAEFYLIEKKWK